MGAMIIIKTLTKLVDAYFRQVWTRVRLSTSPPNYLKLLEKDMVKTLSKVNVDEDLEKMLKTDPLREAEEVTGKSYKEDEKTEKLGFALHMLHADSKRAALMSRGDSHYGISLGEYLRIVTEIGFEPALELPFYSNSSEQEEKLYIMWHNDGILLVFDTFRGMLNGGKFYYNCEIQNDEFFKATSSGHCARENVWAGDHDCREAIKCEEE